MPNALKTRPTLDTIWQYPYHVWGEISPGRKESLQGVGRIPFSELYAWGQAHNYTSDDYELVWHAVKTIDRIWVGLINEKLKSQTPPGGAKPPAPARRKR